jgi:hypothetical protein
VSSIQEEGLGELISFILFKAVNTCLHAEVRDSPDIYAKGLENVPPVVTPAPFISARQWPKALFTCPKQRFTADNLHRTLRKNSLKPFLKFLKAILHIKHVSFFITMFNRE